MNNGDKCAYPIGNAPGADQARSVCNGGDAGVAGESGASGAMNTISAYLNEEAVRQADYQLAALKEQK